MYPIYTKDLVTGYGKVVITKNINVKIPPGKITTIIGGSGSGKTTFFKTIIGLNPPVSGSVYLLGTPIWNVSDKERMNTLKKIGMLFQQGALLNSLTIYENVMFPLKEHFNIPQQLADILVKVTLEKLDLLKAVYKFPSELSGGMKKRAALARALIHEPEVLLCDEPSAGLDPITAKELDALLLNLKKVYNLTIVVVTHELESIKRIADYIIMLGRGYVHFEGDAKEFFSSEDPEIKKILLKA